MTKRLSSFPSVATHASIEPTSQTLTGNTPVFIHGLPEDTSFATQIANLRQTNQLVYEEAIVNLDHSLQDNSPLDEMRIRVAVRKRPMIPRKETLISNNNNNNNKVEEVDVIHPMQYLDYGKILVYQPKTRVDLTREVETISFAFDNVYDETSTNTQIYNETIRALIPGLFEGRWASVFAYGQTGSGKTFTMMGSTMTGMKAAMSISHNNHTNHKPEENLGLYFLAARDLFAILSQNQHNNLSIGVSLFEIYGGKLFDLLNDRTQVKCLEDHKGRVCFPGLSEHPVSQADQLMRIIEDGNYRRSTGSTSANADSSRSHAVLQLCLRKHIDRKSNIEHGRLTFIDLAGSERGADTNKASKTTRLEGAEINTSLLALKEVIRALAMDGNMNHIPFRGSKLTQVLKESFVGKNSRTVMIACVAPNLLNCEHTLNTLRYTDRVKERNSETGNVTTGVTGVPLPPKLQKRQTSSTLLDDRPSTAPTFGSSTTQRLPDKQSSVKDIAKGDLDHEDIEVILEDENDYHGEDASHAGSIDLYDVLGTPPFNPNGFPSEGFSQAGHFSSTAELDEILQSPRHKGGQVISSASNESVVDLLDDDASPFLDDDERGENSSSKDARSSLMFTHRTVMTQMLSMVKQEMLLVNCADTDRELVDEYIIEIERMHEKQLSMINDLRSALLDYSVQRPSATIRTNQSTER
jgi:kinesin family protein 2/24